MIQTPEPRSCIMTVIMQTLTMLDASWSSFPSLPLRHPRGTMMSARGASATVTPQNGTLLLMSQWISASLRLQMPHPGRMQAGRSMPCKGRAMT